MSVLDDARSAVNDRGSAYGTASDCFARIAARWSLVLGISVTPAQVALCMIDLKMARLTIDPTHRDSIVDVAGYAECMGTLSE